MWSILRHPVETHLGYFHENRLKFDIFLAADEQESTNFKQFTAVLDTKTSYSVLLNKSQAISIGIDIDSIILHPEKTKENLYYVMEPIDCNIPLIKTTEPLAIYKHYKPINGFYILNEETALENQNEVIVGSRFLQIFRLRESNDNSKILSATVDANDLEIWDLNIENLNLFQILKLDGKELVVGQDIVPPEVPELSNTMELEGQQRNEEDDTIEDSDSSIDKPVKRQNKKLIGNNKLKIEDAAIQICKMIEQTAGSKEKVLELTAVLSKLLSPDVSNDEKLTIVKNMF